MLLVRALTAVRKGSREVHRGQKSCSCPKHATPNKHCPESYISTELGKNQPPHPWAIGFQISGCSNWGKMDCSNLSPTSREAELRIWTFPLQGSKDPWVPRCHRRLSPSAHLPSLPFLLPPPVPSSSYFCHLGLIMHLSQIYSLLVGLETQRSGDVACVSFFLTCFAHVHAQSVGED